MQQRCGAQESGDESGNDDPQKKKQRRKGDEEDPDDIDEDAELQLLQAVQDQADMFGDVDSQDVSHQSQPQPFKQQQQQQKRPSNGVASPNKKRRSTSTIDQGPALTMPINPATTATGSAASHPSTRSVGSPAAASASVAENLKMQVWSKCQVLLADTYGGAVSGCPFAPPACFTKDVQRAKWESEVAKLKPFISTLERVLAIEGGKLKDNEAKNAAKAFAKVNGKMDKKLGFESAAATDAEKTFSSRVHAIRDAFEFVKSLRDFVLLCSKSGSYVEDQLVKYMEGAQKSLQLLQPNLWVGFPFLWVQAGLTVLLSISSSILIHH